MPNAVQHLQDDRHLAVRGCPARSRTSPPASAMRLVRVDQRDPPGRSPVLVQGAHEPVRPPGADQRGDHVEEAAHGVDRRAVRRSGRGLRDAEVGPEVQARRVNEQQRAMSVHSSNVVQHGAPGSSRRSGVMPPAPRSCPATRHYGACSTPVSRSSREKIQRIDSSTALRREYASHALRRGRPTRRTRLAAVHPIRRDCRERTFLDARPTWRLDYRRALTYPAS